MNFIKIPKHDLAILILFGSLLLVGATTVGAEKNRIVALSPAVVEIIYALNLQDSLVGVSEFSDYPPEAKSKPRVGPYTKPNLEKIVELRPNLIFLPVEGPEDVKTQLERLKIQFMVIDMRSLAGIEEAALKIAQKLGAEKRGRDFSSRWEKDLRVAFAQKRKFTAGAADNKATRGAENRPKVFIEIQSEPLIVAGGATFLNEITSRCGGENIFQTETGYPRISKERLFAKKPDLIFIADYFSSRKDETLAVQRLEKFGATSTAKIKILDPDIATRPGPRLLGAVQKICSAIGDWQKEKYGLKHE